MKKFIVLYSGGKQPTNPQEGQASMKVWQAWFEKLGNAVLEAGAPFGSSKTVSAAGMQDGGGGNLSNGYSLLQADSLADAGKLVKECPILSNGGKVHVFELAAM